MAIDQQDLCRVAHLARLQLNPDALESTTRSMNAVLGLIDSLDALDTTNVAPLAHPLDATQSLREDVVSEQNQREVLQASAPSVSDGYFLVPRVIE